MELEVYKKDGTKSGDKVKLSAEIFGIIPNEHAIYRAVRVYLDNQRQGTAKVKTRAEIRGGGKKPFKQKHTGQARQGSSRSPVNIGGGAIFGPKPHTYKSALPGSLKTLARKSALSHKAKEGQIKIVEDFTLDAPKTAAKLNELVSLTGHAMNYTGAAVDGAPVKYRVERMVQMPWWWRGCSAVAPERRRIRSRSRV